MTHKSIYSPSEDSYLLSSELKKLCKNKSVLDLGAGSGFLAETALNNKASFVLATDINIESISLLKLKFQDNKKIKIIQSNLFSNIPKSKKFHIIVFNPPYLPLDKREPDESRLSTTGGKRGDEIILKFLKLVPSYLSENGFVLLLISSLTPTKNIDKILKKLNLTKLIISSKKLFYETLYVLKIQQTQNLRFCKKGKLKICIANLLNPPHLR
jgi:release factor glutamine methyltransferase